MPNGDDKNWIRLCAAIDGFKVRFGYWPTEVCLPESILNGFDEGDFKTESMSKIREKIKLTGKDVPFVAQDGQGNQYSYEIWGTLQSHSYVTRGIHLAIYIPEDAASFK